MNCAFCSELRFPGRGPLAPAGVPSRVLLQNRDWCLIPTLGCFREGYVLLISREHFPCLSVLPPRQVRSLFRMETAAARGLRAFGADRYIAFEHGVALPGLSGPASVSHAHLHLLPVREPLWPFLRQTYSLADFSVFSRREDLFARLSARRPDSYLFFRDADGAFYLSEDGSRYPSQFFRRAVAEVLCPGVQWDWRLAPYPEKMLRTCRILSSALASAAAPPQAVKI